MLVDLLLGAHEWSTQRAASPRTPASMTLPSLNSKMNVCAGLSGYRRRGARRRPPRSSACCGNEDDGALANRPRREHAATVDDRVADAVRLRGPVAPTGRCHEEGGERCGEGGVNSTGGAGSLDYLRASRSLVHPWRCAPSLGEQFALGPARAHVRASPRASVSSAAAAKGGRAAAGRETGTRRRLSRAHQQDELSSVRRGPGETGDLPRPAATMPRRRALRPGQRVGSRNVGARATRSVAACCAAARSPPNRMPIHRVRSARSSTKAVGYRSSMSESVMWRSRHSGVRYAGSAARRDEWSRIGPTRLSDAGVPAPALHGVRHRASPRPDARGRNGRAERARDPVDRRAIRRRSRRRAACGDRARRPGARRSGPSRWPEDEERAFAALSPLVAQISGLAGWPAADRRSLVLLMRAKGGDEFRFHDRLRRHRRFAAALETLARGDARAERAGPPRARIRSAKREGSPVSPRLR